MNDRTKLRVEAESRLVHLPTSAVDPTPDEMRGILHELQVHQVELEMQNEELRRIQAELAASRQHYFDLYHLAPVGYLTLNETDRIGEANLSAATLLGEPRSALVGQRLSRFVHEGNQDLYYLTRKQLVATSEPQSCELLMVKSDATQFSARLECTVAPEPHSPSTFRVALSDITGSRRAQEALRRSEQKYRELHESMMDAYVRVDMSGYITESNLVYQDLLGYTREELGGLTYVDLTPEKWHAFESRVVAEQILPRGYSDLYVKEYRRKDGSVLPVELRTFLTRDAADRPASMWAIARDITERKQMEQALREWNATLEQRVTERTLELQDSEARFRQLADATFEGIAISEDCILLDANRRFAEMHGYELAEVIGRPVSDFIAPESRTAVLEHMRNASEATYEFLGMRKDGSVLTLEVHNRTGLWLGRPTRISALRDITPLKQANEALAAQQAELAHAQHLALISEVSAGIIHQLGQPLSAIATNLSALVKLRNCESMACDASPIIQDVQTDVARMREIVIHLRALTNPMQPTRLAVDINAIVTKVRPLLRQHAETLGGRLDLDLGGNLPTIHADAVQMSQVILNLVRNAFEAALDSPPERRAVLVTTRAKDGHAVELCVRDSGTGIAPELAARLFSPFFSTKADGLGVGLRLSQTIVQAHGGTIEGDNNPDGIGATFRIVLPAQLPNEK